MSQTFRKIGAFLGLVEDYDDDYAEPPDEQAAQAAQRTPEPRTLEASRTEPSNVRRIAPAPSRLGGGLLAASTSPQPSNVRTVPSSKVHVMSPTTFNDVEEVGEKFRNAIPVIMNLAGASESVAKRMLDFASGLIYGLDGRIERVGDRVFLLTPVGTDVSTEERKRLSERGFFNQA